MSCRKVAGMTLIELMIIVVIIGILSAIAIPNLVVMEDRSRERTLMQNMHVVQQAVELFATQNDGLYPQDEDDLRQVKCYCPKGQWPTNPFGEEAQVTLGTPGQRLGQPGKIEVWIVEPGRKYDVIGYGADSQPLVPVLSNY